MAKASPELEAFIDETIKRGIERDYHPTVFIGMRQKRGTVAAISQLVLSGDLQSGFIRLRKLGLLEWTIEAAVVKFPKDFPNREIQEAAAWRLAQARCEAPDAQS